MKIDDIKDKIQEEYLKEVMSDYTNPRNVEWRNSLRALAEEDASELESFIWNELSELEYHKDKYYDAIEFITYLYNDEILDIMKKGMNMNDEEFDAYVKEEYISQYGEDEITFRYIVDGYAFDNHYWFDDAVREFVDKVYFDY